MNELIDIIRTGLDRIGEMTEILLNALSLFCIVAAVVQGLAGVIQIKAPLGRQRAFAAEMPLADAGSRVTIGFQRFGQSDFLQWKFLTDFRVQKLLRGRIRSAWEVGCKMEARRRFARENRGAGRRTNRLRAIRCRETHAVARELIEVGRVVLLAAVTSEITDAKIQANSTTSPARNRSGRTKCVGDSTPGPNP